jgi:hypothetical protein
LENLKLPLTKSIECNNNKEFIRRISLFLRRNYKINKIDFEKMKCDFIKYVSIKKIMNEKHKKIVLEETEEKDGLYEDYIVIDKIKLNF